VEADLHPFELVEDVVREVERAVGEDVALAAVEDAERRQPLVRRGDLLGLAADPVRVEPCDDADRLRVVADRQVFVAERARRLGHLEHRRLAVRGGRVHVQVAADVLEPDEVVRRLGHVRLAKLGRAERESEPPVDRLLRLRVGQQSERRDVLRRAGRAQELRPEALRRRGHELDRVSLRRDRHGAPLVLFEHRHDLGKALEAK
jgi:hypothetical protein